MTVEVFTPLYVI